MALLELDAALERLNRIAVPSTAPETIALAEARGRILAQDVVAAFDLPSFDNSAVDGYAVRAVDVSAGCVLRVAGTSFAGTPYQGALEAGTAVRIATGGMLPQGADAIAMQEVCEDRQSEVLIREVPEPGVHCRRAGQDVKQGVTVLKAGTRLAAPTLAMATALGTQTVTVRKRLRVAIASTGSELIEWGVPAPGQIFDSNRILLRSALHPYEVEIVDLGILQDEPEATHRILVEAARTADLILTSGGVSVGARDYVRDTIEAMGDVLFWRLALRPGKPLLCGRIDGTPIIGLPGNPVSSFVTFQLVCRPLLLRLAGCPPMPPLRVPVTMAFTHRKPATLREFVRVGVAREGDVLTARPFRSQLSNLVSSLLESDGILDLPTGRDGIAEGEVVDFMPWSGFGV